MLSPFGYLVDNAAMNMVTLLAILLGIYPEIELLVHIVILFLISRAHHIRVSNVVAPFYIPNNSASVFSQTP